jgi:hypothetical protein
MQYLTNLLDTYTRKEGNITTNEGLDILVFCQYHSGSGCLLRLFTKS